MIDREQLLKSLRQRLQNYRESCNALKNEAWYRSHSAIIATRENKAMAIALADADCIKRGHGGFGVDVAGESATTRHIVGTCPRTIWSLINTLEALYPELKGDEK